MEEKEMSEKRVFWELILGREIISFLRGAFCWLVLSLVLVPVVWPRPLAVCGFVSRCAGKRGQTESVSHPFSSNKISLLRCLTPPALQPSRHWVANRFELTNTEWKLFSSPV